jgi:uncharacterized protein involved in exopolysaccharide biosynthesis
LDSEIVNFVELFRACLRRWYWIVLAVIIAGAVSVALTLSMPNQYRAEVVLSPVTDDPRSAALNSLTSSLGGLAALAGIGGTSGSSIYETVTILESRSFGEAFIAEQQLMPHLFSKSWDHQAGNWLEPQGDDNPPELWDGYKIFDRDIRSVNYDRLTSLVEVSFTWTDPELATRWLTAYVAKLNESQRNRAMIQTIMLARGRQEYAFKTLSPAVEPREKISPRRAIIVMAVTSLVGFLAVVFVLAVYWRREREE